jgi:hypothetical protein
MLKGDIYLYYPPRLFPSLSFFSFLYFISPGTTYIFNIFKFLDQEIRVKEEHFYLGIALLILLVIPVHVRHLEPGRLHLVYGGNFSFLSSVSDPDPGSSGVILTPGSGSRTRDGKNPDPRSGINIPDHISVYPGSYFRELSFNLLFKI